MEQFQYTKEDLEQRLNVTSVKGEKIEKCLEYAIARLVEYHNEGAKGLIVDDAFFDLYRKFEGALNDYRSYNNRVTKKINAKLEAMKPVEKERSSSIPRRSIG
jgi:hypothetical protein